MIEPLKQKKNPYGFSLPHGRVFFPSSSYHLTVVEGFVCPNDPRSYVVRGFMPLKGHPRQTGRGGGTRLRVAHPDKGARREKKKLKKTDLKMGKKPLKQKTLKKKTKKTKTP